MDKTVPMWVASLSDESWSTATDAGTSFCLAAAIYLVQLICADSCRCVLWSWALVVTCSNSYCFAFVLNSFMILRTQNNCIEIFALLSFWFNIHCNTDSFRSQLWFARPYKRVPCNDTLLFATTRMYLAQESCSLEPKGWRESLGEHFFFAGYRKKLKNCED